jgi:exonuclease III
MEVSAIGVDIVSVFRKVSTKSWELHLGSDRSVRRIDGRRWERAERLVMEGGARRTLVDVYRRLHGYSREDFSWFLTRGSLRIGRRFDHVFCSPDLHPLRCEYVHEVRERGLSDHSALQVEFDL